jgi:signal recognition particle receptor subunit beta
MSFINYAAREIHCKLVYYGPGRAGKTTNVEHIHKRTLPEACGRLIKLDTETERTLFFDFMPLALGKVRGFDVRFHVYTVPGQVFYDATRKLVLRGLDGVVFVADSQLSRLDANLESLENLQSNLTEQGCDFERMAFVIQYNKRDAPGSLPVEQLRAALNPARVPDFEAVAAEGVGVFETLKTVSKMMLTERLSARPSVQPGGAR